MNQKARSRSRWTFEVWRAPTAACFGLLSACGAPSDDAPPAAESTGAETASPARRAPDADEPADVIIAEAFGPAAADEAARITDIAFWSHPTLAFNSHVVTAGASGVTAYNIETGDKTAEWSAAPASSVAVIYDGVGSTARAIALIAEDGAVEARLIGGSGRAAEPAGLLDVDITGARLCAGAGRGYYVAGGEVGALGISVGGSSEGGVSAVRIADLGLLEMAPAGARDCAVKPLTGDVYILTASGEVYLAAASADDARLVVDVGFAAPAAVDLGLKGPEGDGDDLEPVIAVLSRETGEISLFSEDGDSLGRVRLAASFDYPAVDAASGFGFGFGNYGAVYRDGAIAVAATSGDGAAISVIPWNGVANALARPVGAPVDPRALQPVEEEGVRLDIDPREP